MPRSKSKLPKSTASLGFEAKLWLTAASEGEKTHRSVDLLGRVYGDQSLPFMYESTGIEKDRLP